MFERNLVDYRRNQAAERRRPKEERELLSRTKHFAQMQTALDYEDFLNGLCYEEALRKAAAQLQHYRKMGILTLEDASTYEREKSERARKAAELAAGGLAAFPASGAAATPVAASARPRIDAARARQRETSTPTPHDDTSTTSAAAAAASSGGAAANGKESKKDKGDKDKEGKAKKAGSGANGSDEPKTPRKPPQPLNLAKAPSLNLLTPAEVQLCSALRILPQPFLVIKSTLIAEFIARGGKLTRRECRTLIKIDVNKLGKVWDFFSEMGYFDAAREAGWTGGIGSPPRSRDKLVKKPEWLDGSMAMSASYSFAATASGVNGVAGNGKASGVNGVPTSNGGGLFDLAHASPGLTSAQQQQAQLHHNARGAPLVASPALGTGGGDAPQSPSKQEKYRPTAAV
ncbi:hypothetical protein PaG_04204 [Moesziomyces aphidis]|uniref:SWIRM domain-containing protein n=1 Tax=Moesziomyces aphidis TaxID=84754 RepID=W3VJ57_MOEAP|nr:hypothetical protein PaG_04204 [Moesziomyces aphidis]